MGKALAILAVGGLLLAGMFVLFAMSDTGRQAAKDAPARPVALGPGDQCVVVTPTRSPAIAARSRHDWQEFSTFYRANDGSGVADLLLADRAMLVQPHTRALILERDGDMARVRLLSGEHAGQDGWTSREWLQPAAMRQ